MGVPPRTAIRTELQFSTSLPKEEQISEPLLKQEQQSSTIKHNQLVSESEPWRRFLKQNATDELSIANAKKRWRSTLKGRKSHRG
jgi:hypothetical protein